jgi:hypothetical protein
MTAISTLVFVFIALAFLALPFLISYLSVRATEHEKLMRPMSAFLRASVAVLGVVLVSFSFATGDFLFSLGMLAFFAAAFAGLSFSGVDALHEAHPVADRWFLTAMLFGVIGALVALISLGMAIHDGDLRTSGRLAAPLAMLCFVWCKYGKAVLARLSLMRR